MADIDTGELLKAYDGGKTAHVPAVKADHAKHAEAGSQVQEFSASGILGTFCSSWTADKAAMHAAMFWLNMFYPKAALVLKGLEAVGDQLHNSACPKA